MLKKMFKTILVLSLCIGVVLPTNAAVSVSDGSAFVTKAEFAADLNNLSNRMAQLENSLDAKIDSLVSSYLTRNGIWNGAKQDIKGTNGVLTLTYGYKKGDAIGKKNLIQILHSNATVQWSGAGGNEAEIILYNSAHEYDLIDSCNKAGMLVLSTTTNNYRESSTTRCSYGFASTTTTTANGDHFAFVHTQDYVFMINGTKEGGRAHCEFIATAAPAAIRCPQVPSGTVLFFVSKGDKITVKDTPNLIKGDGSVVAATLVWYEKNDNAYSYYDYVINSAYIY